MKQSHPPVTGEEFVRLYVAQTSWLSGLMGAGAYRTLCTLTQLGIDAAGGIPSSLEGDDVMDWVCLAVAVLHAVSLLTAMNLYHKLALLILGPLATYVTILSVGWTCLWCRCLGPAALLFITMVCRYLRTSITGQKSATLDNLARPPYYQPRWTGHPVVTSPASNIESWNNYYLMMFLAVLCVGAWTVGGVMAPAFVLALIMIFTAWASSIMQIGNSAPTPMTLALLLLVGWLMVTGVFGHTSSPWVAVREELLYIHGRINGIPTEQPGPPVSVVTGAPWAMPVWFEWSIWCWLRTPVSETYTTWLMLDNAMGANFFVLLLTRFSTAKKKDEGDVSAMGLHEISLWGVTPDLPMIVWLVFTVFYLMHGHMYRVLCLEGGEGHTGVRVLPQVRHPVVER